MDRERRAKEIKTHTSRPHLAKGISSSTQIIPGDLGHDVMRHVNVNIKAQELNPTNINYKEEK